MDENDWTRVDAVVAEVLHANCGVAKMKTFLAAGLTNNQVAAVHRRGLLDRPRDGWYSDPALSWQARYAVRVGGVLACVSAVDSFGLPVPAGSRAILHVRLPTNSPRVRHHRDKRHDVVPDEDREVKLHWSIATRPLGWRTPLVESLVSLVDCVPETWFVAALDAALHVPWEGEPVMSHADLDRLDAALPRHRRPLLRMVDPRAGSLLETLVRLGLAHRGVGPVVPQFSPDGRRFVDFLVGDRLIVEADGEGFHDAEKDALRDAFFRSLGYTVLRFSYERIVNDLDGVLDDIQAALTDCIS